MCRIGATIRCPDEYGNLFSSTNARSPRWTTRLASPSSPAASRAEDAPVAGARLLHVCEPPGRPQMLHSTLVSGRYRIRAAAARAMPRGRGAMPHRVRRDPRTRTVVGRRDRRRRDPHDGDRRASGRRAVVRAVVREPCLGGVGALLRRRRRASIQCVREEDIAWHARGGNTNSIGIELAGFAAQRPAAGAIPTAARCSSGPRGSTADDVRTARDPAPTSPRVRPRRPPSRRHRPRGRQRRVREERPLGSRRRIPVGALPPPRRAAAHVVEGARRPEATSSSSARVITSGGEIWSPPPTSVRVRTPWSRAFKVMRSAGPGRRRAAPGRSAPRRRRRSRRGSR